MIGWFLLAVLVVIGALLVDHLGLVGREPKPITLGRIIGAGLMLLGEALVLWFRWHRPCSSTTTEGTFGGVSDLLTDLAPSLFVAAETYPVETRFVPTFSATLLLLGRGRARCPSS